MISAWWIIPSVIVGAIICIFVLALCPVFGKADEKTAWERDN